MPAKSRTKSGAAAKFTVPGLSTGAETTETGAARRTRR